MGTIGTDAALPEANKQEQVDGAMVEGLIHIPDNSEGKSISTVESCLREHIALLQDLLGAKRHWYETALEEVRNESKNNLDAYHLVNKQVVALKIGLTQATREVLFHNEQADNPHTTETNDINYWNSLLKL